MSTTIPYRGPRPIKSRQSLPNRVQSERIRRGMSLKALADLLGVSPQMIHKLEVRGEGMTNVEYWQKMATIFGRDIAYLRTPEKSVARKSTQALDKP